MHGAGEQQQHQQQQRYRYPARNEEQNHQQPSTSGAPPSRAGSKQSIQVSLLCTPSTALPSAQPIKIGDSILQPAGTLVFNKNGTPMWTTGQKIIVPNKQSVMQANVFPIGPPVLSAQAPLGSGGGGFYINPQPKPATPSNAISSNASATPDSGIQSVPTSPPSPGYEHQDDGTFDNEEEDDEDPEDFTDMPRLRPVDEEDECYDVASTSYDPIQSDISTTTVTSPPVHSTTTPSPKRIEHELTGEMNAEEFLSFSLASNMNTDEIVKRLFELDPNKANSIAMLIKKRSAEESKSKKKKDMEAEVSSTTPTAPRTRCTRNRSKPATRSTNSPDVTTSTLIDEPSTSTQVTEEDPSKVVAKKRGRKPKKKRVIPKEEVQDDEVVAKKVKLDPEMKIEKSDEAEVQSPIDPVQFRLKVHEMMERQLNQLAETMSMDMMEMRLSHGPKVVNGKRKESFFRQLAEQSKRLRKNGLVVEKKRKFFGKDISEVEAAKKVKREKEDEPTTSSSSKIKPRLSSRLSRAEDSPEKTIVPVEEKFNGEYYEIPKSVPHSDDIIPLWRAPSLSCGCNKGACTSDMECLNRALRVQCGSECTVPYCSNRRFWKEDCGNKLFVSSGQRTRKVLKTKIPRKSGEFLCEYAGEVITTKMAQERFEESKDPRIIAIGSQLSVDSSNRGNAARFIKHSCNPNCRLEVWSVSGFYRAGVFALLDLSNNVEITVDKSGFLPTDVPCSCGATNCKKIIKGIRRGPIVNQDDKEVIRTRRFVLRNRRHTIRAARKSGLPTILSKHMNSTSMLMKMKKTLAAFAFRVRRVDGSMPRSMLHYYNEIQHWMKGKSRKTANSEYLALFRKWLDAIDDDDLERAFLAIKSHFLPSSLRSVVQPPKKSEETAPRAGATPTTSCVSPTPSKRGDADLSYLESDHQIGSYDPDGAWEAYRANSADNAVRCICGTIDEDGDMVQCDDCQFWLHIDCCERKVNDNSDYVCDFCTGKTEQSPNVDVKLGEQPHVRFENCVYYRSMMNRRGIQVRLNETVYVNRDYSEDHKNILKNLREHKKSAKNRESNKYKFPKAATEPLPMQKADRKDARIFRVERLFVCPGNNRFVFGTFYAYPHETYADVGRSFCKKEVFATAYYETLPLDEVIGRCLVVDQETWCKGRPKVPEYKEDDVFWCEQQVGKNKRVFEKIPDGNKYPINDKSYVFTSFAKRKEVVKDFKPYNPAKKLTKPPKSSTPSTPLPPSDALPAVNWQEVARKRMERVLERLGHKK